ncbi:unnamed protein product [Parajaminaea phylloscopi]
MWKKHITSWKGVLQTQTRSLHSWPSGRSRRSFELSPQHQQCAPTLAKDYAAVLSTLHQSIDLFRQVDDERILGHSGEIRTIAVRAWMRSVTICETTFGEIISYTEPRRWKRLIFVWICHYAAYGSRDSLSGLEFDCSGEDWSVLRPCLCAHRDHSQPFFPQWPAPPTRPADHCKFGPQWHSESPIPFDAGDCGPPSQQ